MPDLAASRAASSATAAAGWLPLASEHCWARLWEARVGKSLDRADRLAMAQATYEALEYGESGTPVTWTNPDSGHSGDVVPQAAVRRAEGTVCREFMKTVTIGGEKQQAYGTACRQADGSWRII